MMDSRKTNAYRASAGCACSVRGRQTAQRTAACAEAPAPVPVMVYIVGQEWDSVYLPCRALAQGTLFPVLDKPFFGKGGCGCE